MAVMLREEQTRFRSAYLPDLSCFSSDFISVRVATNRDALDEIYGFRYENYVAEGKLPQVHADHISKRVKDPLDRQAHNLAAYQGDEVVGVLRINFTRDSDISYYEDFLEMDTVGKFHPKATSISTRLLIIPRLRGSSLAVRLSQAAYALGLLNGIRYNFLDCDPQMTRFFGRLGYVFHKRAEHPEYGVGNVMRLDLLDRLHLAKVRSPFLPILDSDDPWGDMAELPS